MKILCSEILKLFTIVKDIRDAGYVHGDIRESNILCNIDTGVMTIIDFDWLMPVDEYTIKYPRYFYSHPPETYFIFEGLKVLIQAINKNTDKQTAEYIQNHLVTIIKFGNTTGVSDFVIKFKHDNKLNINTKYGQVKTYLSNLIQTKNTIDSYGLVVALNMLLTPVLYFGLSIPRGALKNGTVEYTVEELNNIQTFSNDFQNLLTSMINPNIYKRVNIDEAIHTLKSILVKTHLLDEPSINTTTNTTTNTNTNNIINNIRQLKIGSGSRRRKTCHTNKISSKKTSNTTQRRRKHL